MEQKFGSKLSIKSPEFIPERKKESVNPNIGEFTNIFKLVTDGQGQKRWVHHDHIYSEYKTFKLGIRYNIEGSEHDGYCSDRYNIRNYKHEGSFEVEIDLLMFSKDFINKFFNGYPIEYIGNSSNILDYFKSLHLLNIPKKINKKLEILNNVLFGESDGRGGWCCDCYAYYGVQEFYVINRDSSSLY